MKHQLAAFVCVLVFYSCDTVDLEKIDNLNNGKVDIVGHGGGGFQSVINPLPTNSFTSIKNAIDGLNADGIEIDLKVSSDSMMVLYHDDELEKSTSCFGCPENYSSHELLECKYKNYYGSRAFSDERLILFQELIDHFKNRGKLPHIYASTKLDGLCSTDSSIDKYAKVISDVIAANNAYSWISVYDADINVLNKVRFYNPNIDLLYNAQRFDDALDVCLTYNYSGMVIKVNDVSKEQSKLAHINNKKVIIWGIISRQTTIEAIEKDADAIMTDNIQVAQQILREK